MKIGLADLALLGFIFFVLQTYAVAERNFKHLLQIQKIKNQISSLHQSGYWMFRLQTQRANIRDNMRNCRRSSLTGRMKFLARLETVAKRDIFNNFITSVIASGRYTENDCLYIGLQTAYNTVTDTYYLVWGTDSRFQPNAYNFPWEGGEMPTLNREFCTCVSPRTNAAYGYVVKPAGSPGCDEKHPGICQYIVATTTTTVTTITTTASSATPNRSITGILATFSSAGISAVPNNTTGVAATSTRGEFSSNFFVGVGVLSLIVVMDISVGIRLFYIRKKILKRKRRKSKVKKSIKPKNALCSFSKMSFSLLYVAYVTFQNNFFLFKQCASVAYISINSL